MEEQAKMNERVLEKVRRALGRGAAIVDAPVAPEIHGAIAARVVEGSENLAEIFARMCGENHVGVEFVAAGEMSVRLVEFLLHEKVKRVAMSAGGLVSRLGAAEALRRGGVEARMWGEITLDEVYDFDCGVTDVDYAVAETGSLVVRASEGNGRALSLVPGLHVAVVEESRLLADLVDLFDVLGREETGSAVSLITGPSKTSDIEMTLVRGVHGPMRVQVFVVG
jgi:L-lactate dehydrogenase complex protein LldG